LPFIRFNLIFPVVLQTIGLSKKEEETIDKIE
jgi:hypothetical protein